MTTQGKRIKKIRHKLDLSQEQFGEKLGVSKQYISNIEADRNVLNNAKLAKLIEIWRININYVLAGITPVILPHDYTEEELKTRVMEILKEEGLMRLD